MKKYIGLGIAVAVVIGLIASGTWAVFTDTETSYGNTVTAGTIDISLDPTEGQTVATIDGKVELKPCETGYIKVNVTNDGTNPAEIWKHIANVVNDENGEPVEAEQEWYDAWHLENPGHAEEGPELWNISDWVHYDMAVCQDEGVTVWQIGNVETFGCNSGTELTNYADEFNWGGAAGPCTMGPGLSVIQPPFTDPFIVGTTPTAEFPYNSNKDKNYATDFDVQWTGSLPYGGKLIISWSPGQSASEKKVIGHGINSTTLTAVGTPTSGAGWFEDTYPLVEQTVDVGPLPYGTHTIRFQHTEGDGTFWDWIRLESCPELIPESQGFFLTHTDTNTNEANDPEDEVECHYIYLGILDPGESMSVIQSYHLDIDVGNWGQNDKVTFDMEFVAQQIEGGLPDPPGPVLPGYGRPQDEP